MNALAVCWYAAGDRVAVPLLHVFEVVDGKITRESGWLDFASLVDPEGGSTGAARRAGADGIANLRRRYLSSPSAREAQEGVEAMSADHDLARDLSRAYPDDPADLRRLHERLAASAERSGILDLAYRHLDTPVGRLRLAATDKGMVRVAYAGEYHERCSKRWPSGSAPGCCTPRPALTWPPAIR